MKNYKKLIAILFVGLLAGFIGCTDPEIPAANLTSNPVTFYTKFAFANATVDVPSLDIYVNYVKLGTAAAGEALPGYDSVAITSSGLAGSLTTNTAIRAKATSGSIGGGLGTNDLIYRATNTTLNNFNAVTGMSYTIFAADSTTRPTPLRLNKFVKLGNGSIIASADITYFNSFTKEQISQSRRDSIVGGLTTPPPAANEAANIVTMGLVPLGITDNLGGVRFYVVQDAFQSATALPPSSTTQAAIRFVNLVANSNGITAGADANGITKGGPPIWCRLVPVVPGPPNINLGTSTSTVLGVPGGFNPTVGSRTAQTAPPANPALNFTIQTIAVAGVPTDYTLQVSANNYTTNLYTAVVSFVPGKHYTVFVRGVAGGTGAKAITHGIISY